MTHQGKRHTTSAILSILGLSKSIIIEPDKNIISSDYWCIVRDIYGVSQWEVNLDSYGISKGDIILTILALKIAKDNWDITYYWRWKKYKIFDSSHFDLATIKHFRKVLDSDKLKIMEEIKTNARVDDYKQMDCKQREDVLTFLIP